MPGKTRKPRTYRKKARRDFLTVALSKKPKATKIRAWSKERGIRLSGKPLGRPRERTREEKRQQRQDEKERIPIEGKFGNAKRKGTLQRVMAKLAVTSRTVVSIGLIALNLDALLRFLRALIQQWHIWQARMTAKCRARSCCNSLLTWIYAPQVKLGAAA